MTIISNMINLLLIAFYYIHVLRAYKRKTTGVKFHTTASYSTYRPPYARLRQLDILSTYYKKERHHFDPSSYISLSAIVCDSMNR